MPTAEAGEAVTIVLLTICLAHLAAGGRSCPPSARGCGSPTSRTKIPPLVDRRLLVREILWNSTPASSCGEKFSCILRAFFMQMSGRNTTVERLPAATPDCGHALLQQQHEEPAAPPGASGSATAASSQPLRGRDGPSGRKRVRPDATVDAPAKQQRMADAPGTESSRAGASGTAAPQPPTGV